MYLRYRAKLSRFSRPSFSECGEDVITSTLMDMMSLSQWTYLDIGANDPVKGNNFFAHYLTRGITGINVEPNPDLFKRLQVTRSKDLNIDSIATTGQERVLPFYLNLNHKISSTRFDPNAVQDFIKTISTRDLAALTEDLGLPWVLKIDIEGEDINILGDLLANGAYPDLIVIETFQGIQGDFLGHERLESILREKYIIVAMTPLNNFYAKRSEWIYDRS